jgi:hypothetical protein
VIPRSVPMGGTLLPAATAAAANAPATGNRTRPPARAARIPAYIPLRRPVVFHYVMWVIPIYCVLVFGYAMWAIVLVRYFSSNARYFSRNDS